MKRFFTGLSIFIICVVILLVSLTSGRHVEKRAIVSKIADGRFEIALNYSAWSFGGPCTFSVIPKYYRASEWLYVNSLSGELPANNIILTYERGKTEDPWPQSALHGAISIDKNVLKVNLQTPNYKDGVNIDHYDSYVLNGTYDLIER